MSTFEEIYHEELVRMTKSMIETIHALEKESSQARQELYEFKMTIENRERESSEWLDNFLLESENNASMYISCGDNKRRRIQ